jgi:hypothetical protein
VGRQGRQNDEAVTIEPRVEGPVVEKSDESRLDPHAAADGDAVSSRSDPVRGEPLR